MTSTSSWPAARLALTLLTLWCGALGAQASDAVPKQFEGLPVVMSEASGAASNLKAQAQCGSAATRTAAVTLAWSVAATVGSQQRVLVSIYGFRDGRFDASEPLPRDQSALVWNRVHGQAIHSWMVLTLQGGRWQASAMDTFEGPTCVADMQPEPKR
jgi:hypothetical protein